MLWVDGLRAIIDIDLVMRKSGWYNGVEVE